MNIKLSEYSHNNIQSIINNGDEIAIMCSGGADSMALLDFLSSKKFKKIHVLHINHNINLKSDSWLNIVRNFSKILNFKFKNIIFSSYKLDWDDSCTKSETNCRNKRYQWIYQYCQENNIKHVFTGHHKNDLLENHFISVFRNRTQDFSLLEKNLNKECNISFYKIFLQTSKNEIYEYCDKHHILYVTDESNFESANLRNVIRNDLMNGLSELGLDDTEFNHYINGANNFFDHYMKVNAYYNNQVKHKYNNILDSKKNKNEDTIRYSFLLNSDDDAYMIASVIKYFYLKQFDANLSNDCFEYIMKQLDNTNVRLGRRMVKVNEYISFRFNDQHSPLIYIFIKRDN